MKLSIITISFALLFQAFLLSCSALLPDSYRAALPPLPQSWTTVLDGAQVSWRFQYLDREGRLQVVDAGPGKNAALNIAWEYTSAVLAWPYTSRMEWGTLFPAGAIFPLDVKGGSIVLSWEAGPQAWFYHELSRAGIDASGFNWTKFRPFYSEIREKMAESAADDPWLLDWKGIAQKIAARGFKRSDFNLKKSEKLQLALPPELLSVEAWAEQSPFTALHEVPHCGEGTLSLNLRPGNQATCLISKRGILKYQNGIQFWLAWD
jgi:hypothetical protein